MRVLVFLFRGFELLDVAVEFADVLADEGVAFALLFLGCGLPQETSDGLHGGRSMGCALRD